MTWTIPYTFVAGTKAKANEVNENFQSLKQFVDLLEDLSASNELNIANLQQNKADINGNFINRFQVADASSSMDAINKRTMLQYTKNSQGVISGFQLSKFDNNTISCTAGTCYDSTFEYIISSDISLSHTDTALTANSTYYVYVCGDKENQLQAELTFSTSDTTPDVPVGYEHFRRLGSFTTDGSKNIKDVVGENDTSLPIREITKICPDYSRGFNISSGYKVTQPAMLACSWFRRAIWSGAICWVNGQEVAWGSGGRTDANSGAGACAYVSEGDTITFNGSCRLFPLKGVS